MEADEGVHVGVDRHQNHLNSINKQNRTLIDLRKLIVFKAIFFSSKVEFTNKHIKIKNTKQALNASFLKAIRSKPSIGTAPVQLFVP